MTYLTQKNYDRRMRDAYILGGIFFIIISISIALFHFLSKKSIKHQSQVIHSLIPEEYEKFAGVFKPLKNTYKDFFPFVFDNSYLYVFKMGRTIQIDLNKVTTVKMVKGIRPGWPSYNVSISGDQLYVFIMVAPPSVLEYFTAELDKRSIAYEL